MASWLPHLCPSVTMAHCLLRSWSDLCPWVMYQAIMDIKGQPICCGKRSLPQEVPSPALPEPCSLVPWYTLALQAHLFCHWLPNKQASWGEEKKPVDLMESSGCQQWGRLYYRAFLKYMWSPMGTSTWQFCPLPLCITGNWTRGQIKFQRIA